MVKLQIISLGLMITQGMQNSSFMRMPVDALTADTIRKCNLACFPGPASFISVDGLFLCFPI